jgi:hypothetical protein
MRWTPAFKSKPVYDGFGLWLAARRLNRGRFIWTDGQTAIAMPINVEQLRALVTELPWKALMGWTSAFKMARKCHNEE